MLSLQIPPVNSSFWGTLRKEGTPRRLLYLSLISFPKWCNPCGYAVFSECRFSVSAPESHRSVAPLAPIGEVVAESYPIRTVIQFSICPSIGRQREGPEINPLNNQLRTFLPFARNNFCKLFVNGGYNDKKSRYTAHQISGRKSLSISLMKLCTGSEIQKPSMSAFFPSAGRHCTGTAQPQSLSAAALCFIQIFNCGSLMA